MAVGHERRAFDGFLECVSEGFGKCTLVVRALNPKKSSARGCNLLCVIVFADAALPRQQHRALRTTAGFQSRI